MRLKQGARIGRYVIEATLGEGGMARVYRARHEVLRSVHAVKVLNPDLVERRAVRDRFLAEGRILAQLRHRNLVMVTDLIIEPGVAGLVQEFIDGPPLDSFLETLPRPLELGELNAIMLPVIRAVHHAHRGGVIHRDLKPSNIMLGGRDEGELRPVVLDFGVARLGAGGQVEHDAKRRTRTGARIGTPGYMSPEQVRGERDIDHRTDVFALGVMLYQLAIGEAPFDADSEFETMRRIVDSDYVPLADRTPHLPRRLSRLVDQALMREPAKRISSAADFAVALAQGDAEDAIGVLELLGATPAPGLVRTTRRLRGEGASSRPPSKEPHSPALRLEQKVRKHFGEDAHLATGRVSFGRSATRPSWLVDATDLVLTYDNSDTLNLSFGFVLTLASFAWRNPGEPPSSLLLAKLTDIRVGVGLRGLHLKINGRDEVLIRYSPGRSEFAEKLAGLVRLVRAEAASEADGRRPSSRS